MYATKFNPEANTFNTGTSSSPQSRTPGPSKACNQCRVSKVKCDEKLPMCERCLRLGLTCIYRDYFQRLFRDQTKKVAERSQKQWRNRASNSAAQAGSATNSEHDRSTTNTLSRSITPSTQDLSIERFFYDFVVPLDELPDFRGATSNGSYFAFVPPVYSHAEPGSCFNLALSAAANVNFGRRCKSFQALDQSFRDYGKALRKVNDVLRVSENSLPLSVLAAVCLLVVHDHLAKPDNLQRISWSAHAAGAAALLKVKHETEPHLHEVAGLFQTILVKMLIGCISQGQRPPIALEVCLSLMPSNTASATLLCYTYRVAEICADWCDAQTAYTNDQGKLLKAAARVIDRGQALDEEITTWMSNTAEAETIQRLENCKSTVPDWLWPLYSTPGAPKIIHKYPSIHVSHRLQFWRASRLTLMSTIMSALDSLLLVTDNRSYLEIYLHVKKSVELRILDLVDGICEGAFAAFTVSVSHKPGANYFQDVLGLRGYQLLWPLNRALMSATQLRMQQAEGSDRVQWIRTTLSCIRDDLGLQPPSSIIDNIEHQSGMDEQLARSTKDPNRLQRANPG